MNYYPVLLDLRDKKCIVIGGGRVAQRKVRSLLKSKAQVSVISPTLTVGLRQLVKKRKILWIRSNYKKKFLKDTFLVIAATNNKKINLKACQDTECGNILINVVDSLKESNFIVPAVIQNKDLIISISTSGMVPYLARRIKEDIKKTVVFQYARVLGILRVTRQELKQSCPNAKKRKAILANLIRKTLSE